METDENAPPPKTEQPTPSGLLSPFGFLAGVRAMLSPALKDQQSEGSDSPVSSRPILKDVNTSASPRSKGFLNAGQGAPGAQGVAVPAAGDASSVSVQAASPGNWPQKGERTSVASENSFVSAISTDNTSLPDLLQATSPSRGNGIESDTDTSTAYESAGETEGNLSIADDSYTVTSSELNRPFAFSSPYDADHVGSECLTSEKCGVVSDLNETVTLQESSKTNPANVSVSCLVDQLGSLSLSTPAKAHVTLDSDVSGDIIDSPQPDQDSGAINIEVRESLDTTITLNDTNEKDSIHEVGESKVSLNETVNVSSGTSSENLSIVVEQAQGPEKEPSLESDEVHASAPFLPEGDQTFNYSSLNESDFSLIEAKLLEGFEKPFRPSEGAIQEEHDQSLKSPQEPVQFSRSEEGLSQSIKSPEDPSQTSDTLCPSDLSETEANLLAELEKPFSYSSNRLEVTNSHDSQEGEAVATLDSSVIEINDNTSASNVSAVPSVKSPGETESRSFQEPAVEDTLGEISGNSKESSKPSSDQDNIPNSFAENSQLSEATSGDGTVSDANEVRDVTAQGEADGPETCGSSTQSGTSSFEDTPLPVKVPRTFEEILAEQLAAEGQSSTQSGSSFEDTPLPVKVPRTFEEILAEQLAAEGHACDIPDPPNPCSPTPLSEEEPVPVETPQPLKENLAEQFAAEVKEIESSSTLHQGNCSPENPVNAHMPVEETTIHDLTPESIKETESALDEIPIPIKAPRTFEEILAAELAAQSDPEQAVPSFSTVQVTPKGKLRNSLADIISSETSPLESECEPELVCETIPADFETEANSGLDSLIEKCKQQEQDLLQGDTDFSSVAVEASRLSLSCLSESCKESSITSQDSESSECANQTVIMVDNETVSSVDPFTNKSKVGISPLKVVSEDLVQSGPSSAIIDLDAEEFKSGDLFKDPSAFDFLSLHGGTRSARDLRKESLYVKFDPLVGSSFSDSFSTMHPENSSDSQTVTTGGMDTHQAAESQMNTSEKLVSFSPSGSSKQSQDNTLAAVSATPVKGSAVKSSPAKTPAHVMLNETLESIGARGTPVKQEDLIKKLQEHQSVLEEQDKAYQERIAELEQRLQEMELGRADGVELVQEQLKEKDKQLQEKVKSLSELNVIMKEYEKTISRLVAEKSQEKTALEEKHADLIKDRDQAQQHLNNMEIAFADIHTKYERLKSVVEAFKKNEETLNKELAEQQANFDKMQNMYDMLKAHAVAKLENANQDLEAAKQKHQQENAKLKAIIKKLEVKTKSLEETLEQKVKENQALTAICDELINKVGE